MPIPSAALRQASEPTRIFLGWDGPILPRVAAWLLDTYPPLGLGEQVVVVPGRRSGRLLLSHLVAQVEGGAIDSRSGEGRARSSAGLVPPRIVTPGAVLELLHRPPRPLASPRDRVLAWCATLAAAPERFWPGAGATGEPAARLALAWDLVRCQDELGEEGLRLADVPDRAAAALSATGEGSRWRELGELESQELSRLDQLGRLDPTAARLAALAGAGTGDAGPDVILCCLATSRSLKRAFLARFAARVTALVAAPEREGDRFDAWGSIDPRAWSRRQVTVPHGSLVVVGRPRDQAEVVGRLSARWLGDDETTAASPPRTAVPRAHHPASRAAVTIGLADPFLCGVVGEALADRGIPFHDALGRPLAATPPWRLLSAVSGYLPTRSARDLAALLRHPDLERYLGPAIQAAVSAAPRSASRETRRAIENGDWLTVLDLYTVETALDAIVSPLPGDGAGAALVTAVDRALRDAFGDSGAVLPLVDWTARIRSFLVGVYGDVALGESSASDRDLRRALARLGEVLTGFRDAASGHAGGFPARLPDAIDLLFADVAGEPLAAESEPGSLEIVGWLELPLDDAPRLVVAGLDEGAASAALAGGLLDPGLRRALGLEDAGTLYARDLYYLELLAASRDVTFVTGRRGPQGEPLAPRRILLAGKTPDLVETVLSFWAEGEADDVEPDDESDARRVAGATRGAFGPILPSAEVALPARLPVTAFRDYLACPYRFYLRHVLGLRQVRDLPRELTPGDFGRLLHAALGRFARGPAALSDDPEVIAHALDALLAEEAGLRSGAAPRVAIRIQLEQLRRRLRSFAWWQAEQTRAGWTLLAEHTEQALEATLDVDGEPFVVTGRVDRIDRHRRAGFRLLDYKSAEQAATPEQAHRAGGRGARRWIDLQLPLYELMLRQRGLDGPLALGFVNLGHQLSSDPLVLAEWSIADLESAIDTARGVVRDVRARRFWPPGEPPPYDDGLAGLAGDAFPDRARFLATTGVGARDDAGAADP